MSAFLILIPWVPSLFWYLECLLYSHIWSAYVIKIPWVDIFWAAYIIPIPWVPTLLWYQDCLPYYDICWKLANCLFLITVVQKTNWTFVLWVWRFGCFDHLPERILAQMISHLKALNVSFKNFKNCKVTRLLGMIFKSGTLREKGPKRILIVKKIPWFFHYLLQKYRAPWIWSFIKISLPVAKL